MLLKDKEYKVLNKIAHNTKMDCWFLIKTGRHDSCSYDYVFDIENHKRMSLKQGIRELIEGVNEEDIFNLTEDEKVIFIGILSQLI